MKYYVEPIGKMNVNKGEFSIQIEKKYIPALCGLQGFDHLQIVWWFDRVDNEENRSVYQMGAPYKNAPEVLGIFATRSPMRPNPIAISTVHVLNINYETGFITLPYIDGMDETPVLDIKPYTPSIDRVEHPNVPTWCTHWPKNVETSGDFDWENEFNF